MGGSGWWGQGGCERRIEAFVKISKKKKKLEGGWGCLRGGEGSGLGGQGGCEQRIEVFGKIHTKKSGGGGGGGGQVGGGQGGCERRIEELKFL